MELVVGPPWCVVPLTVRKTPIAYCSLMYTYLLPCSTIGAVVMLFSMLVHTPAEAALPGGSQDPTQIPKYQEPLVIPPAMPQTSTGSAQQDKNVDYYEIAVRQFEQQVLPQGMPMTTVWGYGSINHPWTFNYPAFTLEARYNKPVRVKWINDLVDEDGNYLPHLLPVDQTLHWANPSGDCAPGEHPPDCTGTDQTPYMGPVPIITHVHGAHAAPQYDGYPEAWYLPDAANIDVSYTEGTFYDYFRQLAGSEDISWAPGSATFQYMNDQPAATLWYHDHALGLTRLNVYAGPAGFYLLRGGGQDLYDKKLPGPAPAADDLPGTRYYEIPLAIQDRSFNEDGSLFYPDNRAFFEGLALEDLQIPFKPALTQSGEPSDVAPIHNPEFFGNTMVVNGRTWPYLEVEPRRYRFRMLNGAQSRFLLLELDIDALDDDPSDNLPFWQIGAEGGFLPQPVELLTVLLGPAERADVIVDFSDLPVGATVMMSNLGPDEPFRGGVPGVDFVPSDPATAGQVMQFRVVAPTDDKPDTSADPAVGELKLPKLPSARPGKQANIVRKLSLNELDSETVRVAELDGQIVESSSGVPFGPVIALLGTYDPNDPNHGYTDPLDWGEPITENPALGATEIWEIYNFTADAHPIHLHQVQFQVVDRQELLSDPDGVALIPAVLQGVPLPPEEWEEGFKDTVIAYPGQVARIRARFDLPGLYVWHCHVLEHEDQEMMRPYLVGPMPPNLPVGH
jgi:spore coat protein A